MPEKISRRNFLETSTLAGMTGMSPAIAQQTTHGAGNGANRPNILIVIADQVRWDAVGAYGVNPMGLTPNIDAMARRGTLYRHAFTNQPVCTPSRACLFTGQYPAKNGVWRNAGRGVGLSPHAITLATECRKAGYSANYIGKWHLADGTRGPVPPAQRGGFLNLWQASNELEFTSHPYEGDVYDGDGRPIHFQNEYRVDFLTGLAKRFLERVDKTSPFLLVVSYLSPHQQNDLHRMVAPKGYADRYKNPFVPEDLKHFPGDWQQQLPDYYGALKRVDESIGDIHATLAQRGLDRNTIMMFISDHGCHFMTRNTEYKRSGHDASIHIPFVVDGPGFSGGREVRELVGMVDVTPTLLNSVNIAVPETMQGRSTVPLLSGTHTDWRDEIFTQLAEFWTGRVLRTPEWTYVMVAPHKNQKRQGAPNAPQYFSFQLYDNRADPHQLVNLAGRKETVSVETQLRERLRARIAEAGDASAELGMCEFPYA